MRKLCVRERYLYYDDGEPFFYLADTAWELIHRMDRESVRSYMAVRARQGFTAVQTVELAEFDGVRTPNVYGRLPLLTSPETGLPDPARPDVGGEYDYWAHSDFVVQTAAENGLFAVLLPTWGDKFCLQWGMGPEIFTSENAEAYGAWLGARYRDSWNIIWMLGGDRPLDPTTRPIIDAMARGLRSTDPNHLITFHPVGGRNSTDFLGDAEYIDFHTAQSGHDVGKCYASDAVLATMAERTTKPVMDSEPRYEDHPACFDAGIGYFWGAEDVRQNAYWNLMAGACGLTYGNHSVWSCTTRPDGYFIYPWQDVLTHPGAEQMGFAKKLRLRGDYASFRPAPEALRTHYAGMGHLGAARGDGYLMVYSPLGLEFTAALDMPGCRALRAIWFDPRTGLEQVFGIVPAEGECTFTPPSRGKGCDWVLILEKAK